MHEPWCLGIEIGGTKLQLGIGRGQGEILALKRLLVDPGQQAMGIRRQIVGSLPELLDEAGLAAGMVGAVGVGFGGPVDTNRGRIGRSYQIDGWEDFALADWLRDHLGVPLVVLHNDADTAGLAEARFGAGKGHSPLLYMTVGSGIGGALIIEDRIYRGFGRGAGEIGHLQVPAGQGPDQTMTELELVASGWAIARAARERAAAGNLVADRGDRLILEEAGGPDRITGWMVAQAAMNGAPEASAILGRAHAAMAFALVQVIALLAPRRIVIGGGVSLIGETHWFTPIRRLVDQWVFPPFRGGFDIVAAGLGEEVVVHGALAIARDALLLSTLN